MQAIRPLLYWLLFVLVLFTIHTHQLWMERTRLSFSMTLDGSPDVFEALPTLDGRPFISGERLSLFSHVFAITDPKVEPFSTNVFIWYGEHDLGRINLKRAHGTLAIHSTSLAARIDIRGPEFALTLTNSTGTTVSVPTGRYTVDAQYVYWHETGEVLVSMNAQSARTFAPPFGDLELTCNQTGASFQLLRANNDLVEQGDLPRIIHELPQGDYKVVAWHHGNRKDEMPAIKAGATNHFEIKFQYGTAVLESDPSGATVTAGNEREYGVTPLTLSELTPGKWQFSFAKDGYETAAASVEITAQTTNFFRTNMLSLDYTRSIAAARQYLASAEYEGALSAASDALRSKPDDAQAAALQRKARGLKDLKQAEGLGEQGNYTAAIATLDTALKLIPENQRARTLLAEYKDRESEKEEKVRQVRLNRPREVFTKRLALNPDSAFFESHEIKTNKKAAEVSKAILAALRDREPSFTIGLHTSTAPEVTEIVAKRESLGQARICVIVVGQTTDEETQILFEVMEYKIDVASKILGTLFNAQAFGAQNTAKPVQAAHIPLHPSRVGQLTDKMKAQIAEGVRIVSEKIQTAVGS